MHICVTKDENPTLKERKAAKPTAELRFPSVTIYSPGLLDYENPTLKERKAAKPTAELGFPSVTIYSPGLNMNLDLDLYDGEVRDERWREQHLRNNPGDGLAT